VRSRRGEKEGRREGYRQMMITMYELTIIKINIYIYNELKIKYVDIHRYACNHIL
jgi:hypothetical protein